LKSTVNKNINQPAALHIKRPKSLKRKKERKKQREETITSIYGETTG
jgi:hypothetical protein